MPLMKPAFLQCSPLSLQVKVWLLQQEEYRCAKVFKGGVVVGC